MVSLVLTGGLLPARCDVQLKHTRFSCDDFVTHREVVNHKIVVAAD